jgi:hypothetical protein
MNNYKIHWRFCLSNWLAHTFPDSVKTGVAEVSAKNTSEAKIKFREAGYYDVTQDKNGYFRIENIIQ